MLIARSAYKAFWLVSLFYINFLNFIMEITSLPFGFQFIVLKHHQSSLFL